jgi:uncharacterized protein (TIGR02466 family)
MKKLTLHALFPTPVILTNIEREFTKEELDFFNKQSEATRENTGNTTSLDNYLLDHDAMSTIKQELTKSLQMYFEHIIKPQGDVEPYITQAWLNYTVENQYHHKHNHPNSFLSGVMYVNVNPDEDKITFLSESYKQIQIYSKESNYYNADVWCFDVKPGDIIIFPSSLTHMVETKKGPNTRTSLSFNSFIKGVIGESSRLTELRIKVNSD